MPEDPPAFPSESAEARPEAVDTPEAAPTLPFEDVTERKEAEGQLREQAALLELAPVLVRDPNNRIVLWTHGAKHLYGFSKAEALGRVSHELLQTQFPDSQERMDEALRRAGRWEGELVHRTRSGERRVVASQQIVYRDAGGRPARILEVNADLTEVHQAEQARRQAEQRFSLLARSVRDYAIFLMDPEGRITHWNEGAARVKGYTEAEVLGQHVSLFYPHDQLAAGRPQRQLQEAAAQGRSHEENWRVRKGGERFWGDELIVPLRDEESGALLGFAKICRDLTERKAAEDERVRLLAAEQAARKEAEEANRAKDRFLAALSHELRTPLTPVRLALFALEQDAQLSAAAREALALIGRNVEVECRLIDDLLDISRVVHGKLALRPVPLDLVRLRARSPGGLPRRTDRQGLASDGKLGGDPTPAHGRSLAPAAGVLEPAAERGQITPEGGAITVRSRDREGGGVAVEVADTGAGISPELLPKIFDAFERGTSKTPLGVDGLGLGLAIAQAIVQAHGGRILATSAGEGQGATFTVELPAHPEKGTAA